MATSSFVTRANPRLSSTSASASWYSPWARAPRARCASNPATRPVLLSCRYNARPSSQRAAGTVSSCSCASHNAPVSASARMVGDTCGAVEAQEVLEPAPPLTQMAVTLPERPECPGQPQP